jgi:hypothetical protein
MPVYEYQGKRYESAETDPYLAREKIIAYLKAQEAPTTEAAPEVAQPAVQAPTKEGKLSFGQQLLRGEGPDIVKPKRTGSVLEGTTLTPEQMAQPATGPSLQDVVADMRTRADMGYGAPELLEEAKQKRIAEERATRERPEQTFAFGEEFLEKGAPSGLIGLKSIAEGVSIARDVGAIGSAQQALQTYLDIDAGKITTPAEASRAGLSSQSAMKYLQASPEAREQMKQNFIGQISQRKEFIQDSMRLFQEYAKEAEKVKGRVPDFTDVETVRDFTNWLGYNMGSGAVQLAPIMIAALTTGGAGAMALGTTMGLGETINNRLQYIQKQVKELPPEEQASAIEDYIRQTQDTNTLIALGVGALDLAGPVGAILRQRAGKEGVKYFTKAEAAKAAAKQAPRVIGEEFATGFAQEGLQLGGEKALGELEGDVLTKDNFKRLINAAASEAAGGTFGAAANVPIAVAQASRNKAVDDMVKSFEAGQARNMLESAGFTMAPKQEKSAEDRYVESILGVEDEDTADKKEATSVLSNLFKDFKDSMEEMHGRVTSVFAGAPKEETEPELSLGTLVAKYEAEGMNRESATLLANQTLREAGLGTTRTDTGTGQPGISVSDQPAGTAAGTTGAIGTTVGGDSTVATPVGGGAQAQPGALKPVESFFADVDKKRPVDYKSTKKLVSMPIDQFLTLAKRIKTPQKDKQEGVSKRIEAGEQFSEAPYLNFGTWSSDMPEGQAKVTGHEGRHRAMQLKKMGYTHMPVELRGDIRWSEQDDPSKNDYDERYPSQIIGENGDVMPFPVPREMAAVPYTDAQQGIPDVPKVTKGKPGRKPATPEQQAEAKAKQNQMAGASRDAARNAERAAATLAKDFNSDDYATDAEAMDAAQILLNDQRAAIDTLYEIANSPAHRNNKAGKTAKAALENIPAEEMSLAKERAEAKKAMAKSALRSAKQSDLSDSTNGVDNNRYTQFSNAQQALNWVARNGNAFEKLLAKRLLPFLKGVKLVIVDDPSQIPDQVRKDAFKGAVGLYYESDTERVIYLARDGGINNTTFLHEAVHGATIARINEYLAAIKAGVAVSQELAKAVSDMTNLMNQSYAYFRILEAGVKNGVVTDPLQIQLIDMISEFSKVEAFDDVKEFVAYGMTYPVFQEFLHIVPGRTGNIGPTSIDKKNGITRFVQGVRAFFGMDESTNSAMQDLIIVSERLLQAPLTQAQQINAKLPEAARAKKVKVDRTLQKIQRGEAADDVDGFLGDLIKARKWQDAKNIFVASYETMDSKSVRSWVQVLATTQIMDWAKSLMPESTRGNIDAILRATEKMSVMRQKMLTHVAEQAQPWVDFAKDYYKGAKELSRLMHYTTLEEVDPTLEPTVDEAINNDQELAEIRKKNIDSATKQGQITKRENKIREAYKLWDGLSKYGKRDPKSGLFPGQKIYRDIKRHYKNIFDLHRAILDERIAALKLDGDINDANTPKGRLMSAIRSSYEGKKQIGVYFPLMRYGQYWVSFGKGQSREFYMFESEYQRNRFVQIRMAELRKAGDLRTEKQMRTDMELESGNNLGSLRQKTSEASKMLTDIFAAIDGQKGVPDKETLKDAVYQMYLLTMPEQSFRSQFIHRKGTAGFTGDALRNFVRSGYTSAGQLSSLKYAPDAFSALDAADESLKGNPDAPRLSQFVDEIRRRVTDEVHPQNEDEWGQRVANGLGQLSFLYYLTSIASAITNTTAIAIYGWPALSARYGKLQATKMLTSYMKVWDHTTFAKFDASGNRVGWTPVSIGFSKHVRNNPVLNAAFSEAAERGVTEITRTYDLMAMSRTPSQRFTSGTSRAARTAADLTGALFHHSERLNREIMFMTSFELAYNKAVKEGKAPGVNGEAFQQAIDESVKNTYDTMFNYTRFNRPTLFKGPVGQVVFQYRMYPLQATGYFVRNYLAMWKGARGAYQNITKETVMEEMLEAIPPSQRDAMRQNPQFIAQAQQEAKTRREKGLKQLDAGATEFFGSLLMVGMFGGIRAFLGYSAIVGIIQGIFNFMRDEDEPVPFEEEDIDYWFRYVFMPETFGDKTAEILLYGLIPVLTGADVGAKISLNDMWWRESQESNSSFDTMTSALITNIGGPSLGLIKTFSDAYDDWRNGHVSQAIEKASPAFLKGMIAQQRWAEEGVTNKKDKAVLVDREQIGVLERIYKGMGFNPTIVATRRDMQQMVVKHKIEVRKEYDDIMKRIKTAQLNEQEVYMQEAINDWIKWARKNPDLDKDVDAIYNARVNALKARSEAYFGIVEADEEMRNRIIKLTSRYPYR